MRLSKILRKFKRIPTMEITEVFGAMLRAVVWLVGACFVGEVLGRIIAPPINAWVERQNELEEENSRLISESASELLPAGQDTPRGR
jgi:hypothetical protein